jgi:MFS family permease
MLHVPPGEQGRLSGALDVTSEIPPLLFSSLAGAASDKLGRRTLYALGFCVLAASYLLFPTAQLGASLFVIVFALAVGATFIGAMLSAVVADYPQERSRGRLVGIVFFLNGLGIATLVGGVSRLPQLLQGQGLEPVEAGRWTYWIAALLCFMPMILVARGLAPGAPARLAEREPLLATLRIGLAAARDPRVRLAYVSAAVSRAALSIVSAFFFLWMTHAGRAQGMSTAEAYAAGSGIFVTIQISATLWAVLVVLFIDRFDRIAAMVAGSALACASYTTFGLVEDPFQPAMYLAAMFLGIGEMSGVLASQTLIGQVAPERGRGAVIGIFTLFGSVGIFLAAIAGGYLFDHWRPSAPYVVMGLASGALCLFALYTRLKLRRDALAGFAT